MYQAIHRQADAEAHTVHSLVIITTSAQALRSRSSARKHVLLSGSVLLAALLLIVVTTGARFLIGALIHAVLTVVARDFALVHGGKLLRGQNVALVLKIALGEDEIDLLKGATGGLRVQEVDDGEEEGVENSEEQVGVGADAIEQDGSDHHDKKVPEPVGDGGGSVGLSTGLDGVDLGGVQPGQRQPSGTEECNVGKETDGGTLGGGRSAWKQASEGEDHGQELSNGADQEELAATDTLNKEPRSGGEDGVDDHVDTTEE